MAAAQPERKCPRRTFTMDGASSEAYERLTTLAIQGRANRSQVLEGLVLRAEAIYNFQPPLPLPRPWWKLWGKDPTPELPAIVADLRNPPWRPGLRLLIRCPRCRKSVNDGLEMNLFIVVVQRFGQSE